jgi:hypothetical protein
MGKKYIRIYCNDVKVRSTGNEKWYRKLVLENLGIVLNDDGTHSRTNVKIDELINISRQYQHIMKISNKTSRTNFYYKIEIVKSNSSGKHVIKTISLLKHLTYIPIFGYMMIDDIEYLGVVKL